MKPVLSFVAALALLISSCAKKEDINNAPTDLVIGGKLSAYMNGAVWTAYEGHAEANDPERMVLYASRDPKTDKLTDFTLIVEHYHGPDKYTIVSDTGTFAYYTDNVTPYRADSGSITIQYETDSVVRGSFKFNGTSKYGKTIIITNGQFLLNKE